MTQYNAIHRNIKHDMIDDANRCNACGSSNIEFIGSKRYKETLHTNTYSGHDVTPIVGLTCGDCFETLMFDITLDEFLDVVNNNDRVIDELLTNPTSSK